MSPTVSKQVDAILKPDLAARLIGQADFPWASPLALIPQKDSSISIAVDDEYLTSVGIVDKWSLPRVRYLSIFDLESGFFQNAVDPDAIELTAFITALDLCPLITGNFFSRIPIPYAFPCFFFSLLTTKVTGAGGVNICATASRRVLACARSEAATLEHFSAAINRVNHALETKHGSVVSG